MDAKEDDFDADVFCNSRLLAHLSAWAAICFIGKRRPQRGHGVFVANLVGVNAWGGEESALNDVLTKCTQQYYYCPQPLFTTNKQMHACMLVVV